jgi:hypothetical protein
MKEARLDKEHVQVLIGRFLSFKEGDGSEKIVRECVDFMLTA